MLFDVNDRHDDHNDDWSQTRKNQERERGLIS